MFTSFGSIKHYWLLDQDRDRDPDSDQDSDQDPDSDQDLDPDQDPDPDLDPDKDPDPDQDQVLITVRLVLLNLLYLILFLRHPLKALAYIYIGSAVVGCECAKMCYRLPLLLLQVYDIFHLHFYL